MAQQAQRELLIQFTYLDEIETGNDGTDWKRQCCVQRLRLLLLLLLRSASIVEGL